MSYSDPPRPGGPLLAFGVVLPIAAFAVELATGLCADYFFDPIPTWGHALAVLAVPAVNYRLWKAARSGSDGPPWLMAAAGAAIAIGSAYALAFLPLLPISLIAILVFGLGLLAWAPALALVATVKLAGRFVGMPGHSLRNGAAGVLAGLAALALVDLPATATYLAIGWAGGDDASVRRGTSLMRLVGDEAMLLRLCYGEGGRATGLVSFAVATWNEGGLSPAPVSTAAAARELYFRTTGRAFNAVEAPRRAGRQSRLWGIDEDLGGQDVGGRARGLQLDASRLDGSVATADNLAYLEWTAVFANRSTDQQEARLTLALPPGAVASRATLWVNGEPREASVAGRGEARAAYRNVVRVRRDPLLVTTGGAGRLLVQAFPVPARGSLKLRIGVTAPLEIGRDGARGFVLPAIAERNFGLAAGLRHEIWIEGKGSIAVRHPEFAAQALPSGAVQLRAAIEDEDLTRRRPRITAPPITAPAVRAARMPARTGEPALEVVQTIAQAPKPRPTALLLVVDGSAGNRSGAAGLRRALRALPEGLPVGLFVADGQPRVVAPAPWSPAQRARAEQALADTAFDGGEDNLPLLAEAIDAAAGGEAVLLWIHGPQPVAFARSGARLQPLLERSAALPRLVRYQAETGPAFAAGHAWFDTAREVAPSGDARADLAALLGDLAGGGERWEVTRRQSAEGGGPTGSAHIARLWGAERLAGAGQVRGAERGRAIALAHRLNIVTPVSGAVVLETDAEYERSGLAVPSAGDVPTVPEPATWALIAIVAALLLWQLRRRRLVPA